MRAKQRVLVVDDDQLVADTLNLIFLANGFDSEARYSAAEALECARHFQPALLLCDVTMPGTNGLALVEAFAAEMPQCRALLLTAFAENALPVRQQADRLGLPLPLLNKPCHPEIVLREAGVLLAERPAA